MKKRFQITVKGNVQRVGFRNFAGQLAEKLNLTGKAVYVDQDIMIQVEGIPANIETFINWSKTGPEGCVISDIDIIETVIQNDKNFLVIHGITFSDNTLAV